MQARSGFLFWFIGPATLLAIILSIAIFTVFQYSIRSFIPGSLDVGGFTLDNFTALFKVIYANAFWNTLWLSIKTSIFTVLLAYPLAYALVRTERKLLKAAILIIAITPLFLGEIVRTYSWIIVLGNNGFINSILTKSGLIETPLTLMFTQFGVLVALIHVTIPVVVLMLSAALAHINRDYEKAAISLGAGPVRCFLTITLPLSIPGIAAGMTTAFAWTFSAFATPQIIGGGRVNTVATLVYQLGFSSMNFPFAASLNVAGLILTIVVLVLLKRATQKWQQTRTHS